MLSILLPPGPIRLSSGAVVFGLFFYLIFWTREQTNAAYITTTSCCSLILRWLDLIAIHALEKDFWKVSPDPKAQSTAPRNPIKKLVWFASLWNTPR